MQLWIYEEDALKLPGKWSGCRSSEGFGYMQESHSGRREV